MQYSQEQEYEISLRDGIEVLIKRKSILLVALTLGVILGSVKSFTSPNFYEASMVIEPPIIGADTAIQGFDSVENVKARIESGAFNTKILKELNIPWQGIKFNVAQPKNTRLIKVSMPVVEGQTELGVSVLSKLLDELNQSYAKFIVDKRNRVDNQIKIVDNQIKMVFTQIDTNENEIKLKKQQYKILEDREAQLLDEIKETKTNSNKFLEKRDALYQRKEGKDEVSALLYAITMQQNISNVNQLQNELSNLRNNKENILNGIENIKTNIENIRTGMDQRRIEIANLGMSKEGIQNMTVIQSPLVSLAPIGPAAKKIILLYGAFALIMGLFFAGFWEYWNRTRAIVVPVQSRILDEVSSR